MEDRRPPRVPLLTTAAIPAMSLTSQREVFWAVGSAGLAHGLVLASLAAAWWVPERLSVDYAMQQGQTVLLQASVWVPPEETAEPEPLTLAPEIKPLPASRTEPPPEVLTPQRPPDALARPERFVEESDLKRPPPPPMQEAATAALAMLAPLRPDRPEVVSGNPSVDRPELMREPADQAPPQPPSVAAVAAAEFGADVDELPRPLANNPPTPYPAGVPLGLQAELLLELTIDEQGRVSQVRLIRSSGMAAFDRVAVATYRQWRFRPAVRDGEAVAFRINRPVIFAGQ